MRTNKASTSSSFSVIARLASALAAVVMLADAASADPRPGYVGSAPWAKPTTRDLLASNVRYAVKVGTQSAVQTPLKNAAVSKVPCAACGYRPPMLVRSGKFGR